MTRNLLFGFMFKIYGKKGETETLNITGRRIEPKRKRRKPVPVPERKPSNL